MKKTEGKSDLQRSPQELHLSKPTDLEECKSALAATVSDLVVCYSSQYDAQHIALCQIFFGTDTHKTTTYGRSFLIEALTTRRKNVLPI